MIAWFYNLVFILAAVFYAPFLFLRGKWHSALVSRLGPVPEDVVQFCSEGPVVWVHAVSVGEVQAVSRFIRLLPARIPGVKIVLTTVTRTGNQLALSRMGTGCKILYAPLDLSWVVRHYIRRLRPRLYVTAETEIWPNLFMGLARQRVPVVVFNGRVSRKSFARYRVVAGLIRNILEQVTLFCVQTDTDAERLRLLGAPADRVQVLGNVKFDEASDEEGYSRDCAGYDAQDDIWVAGSTHPGEENIVLSCFTALRKKFPRLKLILAPRHIERALEVCSLVEAFGWRPVLWSRETNRRSLEAEEVLVVDTIGHLRKLYALATVVFVGKSLVGGGGQNIIEPAAYGKPVVVGPAMDNFERVVEVFQRSQALVQVCGPEELEEALRLLLDNPDRRAAFGRRAREVVLSQRGATEKSLALISPLILK
ncbi:MAG: 3-deoxy-D-manno-octulosonic acid transferase [Candidatus Omnitrophota bacterium]|jgi:3-deoxy-D-manno-octulosonic-acid transferase